MVVRFNVDPAKEFRFRELAMKKFGYRKGALSFALDEAIDLWIEHQKTTITQSPLDRILGQLRNLLPFLRITYKITTIGIFGSYARNDSTISSDIDLLVEFERSPSLVKFIELRDFLSTELKLNVDLVDNTTLKSELHQRISEEIIYA